jgi:protein SCO1
MSPRVRAFSFAVLLVVAGIGAYAAGTWLRPAPALTGTLLQEPPLVGDLELVAADGRPVTLAEVGGDASLTLVFFGFTNCPDVCPITMARLAKIYDTLADPADVRVVMITVDPEVDTPEIVGRYAAAFHPAFVGLGGDTGQIAVAARAFYVGYASVGGNQYTHTDVVAVVDDEGRLRGIYGSDKVLALEVDLPRLLRQL